MSIGDKSLSRRDFLKTTLRTTAALGALGAFGPLLSACTAGSGNPASGEAGNGAETGGNNGGSEAAGSRWKTGTVANQTFNLENTYFSIFDNSVKEAAAALGLTHLFLQHNADANQHLSQVDQFATNKGSMMVTYCPTAGSVPNFARACQDHGIYMINVWNTPAWYTPLNVGDYYVQWHEPDNRKMGYEVAVALFEKIGGKGKVLNIPGYPGASSDNERTAGIRKALREYPDIELVVGQPGNWNRVDSRRAMEDLLVSNSSFDGVIGQNDDQSQGILEVLKEKGIQTHVVSMDGTPEGLKSVEAGELLCTHAILTTHHGGWSVVQAFDAMNGYKHSIPERMMFQECILITKDNAAAVHKRMYEGATTGMDWVKMSRVLSPDSWDPQSLFYPVDVWEFWDGQPVEPGMGLPPEYEDARKNGEFQRIAEQYQSSYKMKFI